MNRDQNNNPSTNSKYVTPFDVDKHSKSNYSSLSFFQKVSSLTDSIKDLMANPSTADFIEENLGQNFNLNPEQKTEITRIIRDVLLGDLFIGEMAQNISLKAKLSPDEAKRVKDSIVSVLFKPAAEDIKKLQTQKFPEKINRPILEKTDLKIEPNINRNNIVDLRNK